MIVTPDTRHFTASMVVLDHLPLGRNQRVLLVHPKATGLWVFPGGHVDEIGGAWEAPHFTALREVKEETSLSPTIIGERGEDLGFGISYPPPIEVAEHAAPAKANEPTHYHIDFLYLGKMERPGRIKRATAELNDAQWFNLGELLWVTRHGEARADVFPIARRYLSI